MLLLLPLLFLIVKGQSQNANHSGPFPIQNIVIGSGPKAILPIEINPCDRVRCRAGTHCVVNTDGGKSHARCEPCPRGQIYKSCPNCMEVRTCGNKDAKYPCLSTCYPAQCVCPPGQLKNPCGICVPVDKCPSRNALFHCPVIGVIN